MRGLRIGPSSVGSRTDAFCTGRGWGGPGPEGRFHVGLSTCLYLFPCCSLIELSKCLQPLLTVLGLRRIQGLGSSWPFNFKGPLAHRRDKWHSAFLGCPMWGGIGKRRSEEAPANKRGTILGPGSVLRVQELHLTWRGRASP